MSEGGLAMSEEKKGGRADFRVRSCQLRSLHGKRIHPRIYRRYRRRCGWLLLRDDPRCLLDRLPSRASWKNGPRRPRFATIRREAQGIKPCRLLQASDPIPQRAEIFIVKRQSANVLIKGDGMSQPYFRLLNTAHHTRVRLKAIIATLGCIACARSKMASAFSTPSIRRTE